MSRQFVAVPFKTHAILHIFLMECLCNSVNVSTLSLPSIRSFNPTPPILRYSSWWTPLQEEEEEEEEEGEEEGEEEEVGSFVHYLMYCMCLYNIILPLLHWY